MFKRMLRAMRLDRSLYDEVEGDPKYNRESWMVLLVIMLLSGIVSMISFNARQGNADPGNTAASIAILIALSLIGFLIAVAAAWLLGKLLGGRGTFGELRRSMAYAYSPNIFAAVPVVGFIVVLWYMAATFVAIRQSHDLENGRTAVVMIATGILQGAVAFGMNRLLNPGY